MSLTMKIFDAHAHVIYGIDGIKRGHKTATANNGKILWQDEEITFLPPFFHDTTFTADTLVKMMDFSGISKAVLLQNPVIGIINDEIKWALEKYPERFFGTIQVDPMQKDACDIIRNYASKKQNTLKLEISEEWGWSGNYPGFSLLGKEMLAIWKTVDSLGLRVIIDTGDMFNNGYQIDNIRTIACQFPNIKILLEHLGFLKAEYQKNQDALNRRNELLLLGKEFQNIYFGFSSASSFLNDEYPCHNTLKVLQEAVEIMGANKILWGSDIPSTFKKFTYQQLIDVVAKHAVFLTEAEKQNVLYDNACLFFGD